MQELHAAYPREYVPVRHISCCLSAAGQKCISARAARALQLVDLYEYCTVHLRSDWYFEVIVLTAVQ